MNVVEAKEFEKETSIFHTSLMIQCILLTSLQSETLMATLIVIKEGVETILDFENMCQICFSTY